MQEYDELRPKGASTFFCREDGRPLRRCDVVDIIDVCLIMTDWCKINITPHCFRVGKASYDTLMGKSRDIRFEGRWGEDSKAFEAYSKPNLVCLSPKILYNDFSQFRKKWRPARIQFLARCIVETTGSRDEHPFQAVVERNFPNVLILYENSWPQEFPHPVSAARMEQSQQHRESGVFILQDLVEQELAVKERQSRSLKAARITSLVKNFHSRDVLYRQAASNDVMNETNSTGTQTIESRLNNATESGAQTVLKGQNIGHLVKINTEGFEKALSDDTFDDARDVTASAVYPIYDEKTKTFGSRQEAILSQGLG